MPRKTSKKTYARCGKILSKVMYIYVQPANARHARKSGNASAFINALLCKDRGVSPPVLEKPEAKSEIEVSRCKKKLSKKKRRKSKKSAAYSRPTSSSVAHATATVASPLKTTTITETSVTPDQTTQAGTDAA